MQANYLWQNGEKLTLTTTQENAGSGTLMIIGSNGQVLAKSIVNLNKGKNHISLPVQKTNQLKVISLFVGNQIVVRKTIF